MQRIIPANWQHHLVNTLLRGHFMMSAEIALGLKSQVSQILNSNFIYQNQIQKLEHIPITAHSGDEQQNAEDISDEGGKVIVLPVKGTMLKYGTWCTYGTDEIAHYTKHFASKENVAAIVLDIDSGGGAVNAVPPMLDAIAFTKAQGKPIIAHCDTACSAAYWTASACDHIFANNDIASVFGSIGVMISYLDVVPYYEKEGAKYHEVYADQSGDKNLAFQKFLNGEYDQIKQEMLNPMAIQFQDAVKTARTTLKADTPGILSGATYSGQKSINIGLADQIGNLQHAINYASAQAWART